ncbi:RNA polymerase sigma-70 factor [Alistipes sp.]|uniref:RNA polymerase sigma-70 factor n=1 Tax=Alistipes sp. TaxID=1872444 RepID=UPI003A8B95DE
MAERKKGYLCTMDGSENRDHGFFTVLFEEYREPFTRFANSFVRDRAVAENLFVDALVDYWQRRDALPADTNVPAYLLASVRNKALNHLRHQRIRERSSDELRHRAHSELDFRISSLEDFTTQSLFTSEIRAIVRQTLDELPAQTRRIFEMSRFENRKNAEIADELHLSVKTVEFHIGKVLRVLRVRLKDYLLFFLVFILR